MTKTTTPYDAFRCIEVLRRLGIESVPPEGAQLDDAATRQSISTFQQQRKLKVTGQLDGRTTNALHRIMMLNLNGCAISTIVEPKAPDTKEVRRMQALLGDLIEPGPEVTGQMDVKTQAAIKAYQAKGTGMLNSKTLEHMNQDLAARGAPPLDLDLEEVDDLFAERDAEKAWPKAAEAVTAASI